MIVRFRFWTALAVLGAFAISVSGCTVKAVGDPNRPITINAHVTVDIKGLKNAASNIEDYVNGEANVETLKQPKKAN